MITTAQVCKMFDKWEYSGLKPPIAKISETSRLVATFIERFKFMDEATLEYVSLRICSGNVWPTFGVVEQLAKEYQESNKAYVYVDYFKELSKKAYLENESFESFIQRMAERYFPGRGMEWIAKNAFQLHFYGICVAACKDCKGVCPHHGHQYHLRIKRGSEVAIPWASMDICDKYQYIVDEEGNKKARPESCHKDNFEAAATENMPDIMPPELGFDPFSVENIAQPKAEKNKLEETALF